MPSSAESLRNLAGVRSARHVAASRAGVSRTLLVGGCLVAVVWAGTVGDPEPRAALDPALARMLRGMALVKAALTLAVLGLLFWRLGHPLSSRAAAVYLVGTWGMAAASALIWQLSMLPLAAAAFHAGMIALLVAAWRDDGALPGAFRDAQRGCRAAARSRWAAGRPGTSSGTGAPAGPGPTTAASRERSGTAP